MVPNPCLCLSKSDNLAKKLVRAKLNQCQDPPKSTSPITINVTKPNQGNSMPCDTPDCKCCTIISRKCRVTSTRNYQTFPTQKYTCCSTKNVIYLVECTKCTKGNQYVGHTSGPLKDKLTEHQMENATRSNLPLYQHFQQKPDHNFERDIKITILQATTRNCLLETANNWVRSLDTMYPKGLNTKKE